MRAIILAAGLGSRLGDSFGEKPKPLIELKGRTLLEHSLNALSLAGIREVIIVTGHQEEEIINKFGEKYKSLSITYRRNKAFSSTGNMHSLFISLKEPEDCVILEGDLIYDPRAISMLLDSKEPNLLLVTNVSGSGDEMFVKLENEGVIHLSKEKPEILENVYEYVGIAKFSRSFVEKMFEIHGKDMLSQNFNRFYDSCAFDASASLPLKGLVHEDLLWSEIDTSDDIKRALEVLEKLNM